MNSPIKILTRNKQRLWQPKNNASAEEHRNTIMEAMDGRIGGKNLRFFFPESEKFSVNALL